MRSEYTPKNIFSLKVMMIVIQAQNNVVCYDNQLLIEITLKHNMRISSILNQL